MASQFKRAGIANSVLFFGPFIMGFVVILSYGADETSPFLYFGIALMFAGFAALVRSKWDQVRKGDVWTFGISASQPRMKTLYRLSYLTMIAGWFMACGSHALQTLLG